MKFWMAALLILLAGPGVAQQHQHSHSPYAGLQQRGVKALSDQQLGDLRAAAELNGYPGPLHVLELADRLQLSSDQAQRVRGLYEGMKSEAIAVGEKLIATELELDRQFAERKITPAVLASLAAQIGERQGELRAVHLKYHLTTAELLTPDQKRRYSELRGYR
jgi:hypothetical protein